MTKRLTLFLALCAACTASAQQTTAPRFRGADPDYFRSCFKNKIAETAVAERISFTELSPLVAVGFTVDTLGRVEGFRLLDNGCTGRDSCGLEPATEATRRAVVLAFERLEGAWTPAQQDGRPVNYTLRMEVRVPLGKIELQQNPDPLLFEGEAPNKRFRTWVRERVRYHESQITRGQEGYVKARFYVEPDGSITIGEITSPVRKLAREVERVIRKSQGKWSPRKIDGVAERSEVNISFNFQGN